jgi:DNA-binding transcriptional LysR family regulator
MSRSTESTAAGYFREVAPPGSISRADANLFVSPSATSRKVRLLEEDLGVEVFARRRRGLSLTSAGQLLLDFT